VGVMVALAVVWALLSVLRLAVLPMIFGLLLAALVSPIARGLKRFKVPKPIAAALALLSVFAVVGGIGTAFGVTVAGEFSELKESVAKGYGSLLTWAADATTIPREEISARISGHVERVKGNITSFNGEFFAHFAGTLQGLAVVVLALVFAWFFTWDGDKQFKSTVALLPRRLHQDAHAIGERVWKALTGYLQGIVLVATADALLLGLALWIIGVPLVVPLMLLTFLAAFVPLVGPVTAGGMAGLVALAEGGVGMAGWALLAALLVQQIEEHLLQPFIMGRAVELHPVLVLAALTVGGTVGGILGVFLAVPVAGSLKTTLLYFQENREPKLLLSTEHIRPSEPAF
jgi:putative heme transporter